MFELKMNKTAKTATKKADFVGYSMQGLEHLKPGKDYLQALQAIENGYKSLAKAYESLPDGHFTGPDVWDIEDEIESLKIQAKSLEYGYTKGGYNGHQLGQIKALSLFLDGDGLADVIDGKKDSLESLHNELAKIGRRFQADILKEDTLITLLEEGELASFKHELKAIYGFFMDGVKPSNASVVFILLSCLKPKTARKDGMAVNSISVGRVGTLEKAVLTDIGQKLCKLPKKARR